MSVDAVLDSKQKALEAQIDDEVKDPDQRRSAKAQVNGYFSALRATCYTMAADKRYSEDDIRRRALDSSEKIELKVRPFFEKSAEYRTAAATKKGNLADLRARITSAKPAAASTAAPKPVAIVATAAKADRAAGSVLKEETEAVTTLRDHAQGVLDRAEAALGGCGLPKRSFTDPAEINPYKPLTPLDREVRRQIKGEMETARAVVGTVQAVAHEGAAAARDMMEEHPLFEAMGIMAREAASSAASLAKTLIPEGVKAFACGVREAEKGMPERLERHYAIPTAETKQFTDDANTIAAAIAIGAAGKVLSAARTTLATVGDAAAVSRGVGMIGPALERQGLEASLTYVREPGSLVKGRVMPLIKKAKAAPVMAHAETAAARPAAPAVLLESAGHPIAINAPPSQLPHNPKPLIERVSLVASAKPVITGGGSVGETVVILESTFDHNGALASSFTERAATLATGRNLIYERVTSVPDITSTLQKADRVSHVLLRGHGSEEGFALSSYRGLSAQDLERILRDAHFTPERIPEVMLEACCMGKRPAGGALASPAEYIYYRSGGRLAVTAAADLMGSYHTNTSPGSVQFFQATLDSPHLIERTLRVGRNHNHDAYNQLLHGNSLYFSNGRAVRFVSSPQIVSRVLPHDLIVVQCSSGTDVDPWFLSVETAQRMKREGTLFKDADGNLIVSSSLLPDVRYLRVIKIPAGETVNMLTGSVESVHMHEELSRLVGDVDAVPNYTPGAQEHFFYDLDPKWPSRTLSWPLPPHTNLSDFESLVEGAAFDKAESIMPATAAAPESTSARDLLLAKLSASRAAHATPAYRAFDREAAAAALGKAGSPVVTSISPTGAPDPATKPLIERVSLIPSARPLISGGAPAGETVVVVQSIHDKTGAFRVPITARVQQLARGRNLVYKQVDSAQGVADAMGQMGNVSHALIRAHGNPRAIFFDPYGTTAEALAHALRKECFTASRNAEVYLEACSTAAKPLDGSLSFAHTLDELLGERVSIIAARSGVVPSFTQMKPGSVQFYGQLERPEILSAGTKVLRGPEETFRIGRISNSEVYTKLLRGEGITTYSRHLKFSEPPKVFSGATPRDLVFVQYHIGSPPLNTWFISAEDAKSLTTMDAIRKHTVLSDSPASFTHMTVTRIPAGETINILRGKVIAEGKWSSAIHWGEMTQHYFYDFDPKWKSVTLPWPCSSEGLDSFDAIVKAASESRARPTLSLRPKTVYEETKADSIRQPLSKPTAEEAPSASIVVTESIPPLSDVISKTYHKRTETILYRGVLADLEISCIKHTDGTWRVFIQSLAVQGTEIGDQTFTSGLILKALSVTRDIAEKELGASRVVIQWMPVNDKFLSPSFQAHLTRYRHYVGLQNAHNFPPLVMLLKKMGLKVLGKKDGEFPTLVYDLTKQSSEEGLSPASAAETGIPAYAEELIATPQNSYKTADLPSAASLSKVLRMQADNPLKLFSSDAITGLKLYREYTQAVMKKGKTFDAGATPKFPVEGPLERVRAVLPPKGKFSDILTGSGAKPFDLGKGANVNGYYLTDGESTFAVVEKRMSERQALEQLKAVARFQEQNLIDLQLPELLAFELSQNRAGIFSAYEASPSMLDWVQELPSDPIMAREALYRLGAADAELHSAQYGRYFVSLPMRKKYIAELVANYHLVREATMKLGIKVPHSPEEIRALTKEFEDNDQMIASFGLDPEDAHLSNRSYNPTEDTVMIFNLARSSALISAGGTPLGHPMHNYKGTLAALQREAATMRIDEAKLIMPYKSGYKENFVGDTEAEGQFWNVYMKYEEWKTILEDHSQDLPVGFGMHHEDYEALWTKV